MLSPAMIVMAAFVFVPICLTIWISLHNWSMLTPLSSMQWVGLKNYTGLLSDPEFTSAFRNTIVYVLLTLVITVPLSYIFGLLLYFPNVAWKGLVRTLLFATYVIPSVAVALVWSELYEPLYGPLARIFGLLGLGQPAFLSSPSSALLCLVIFQVWQMLGYYTVLVTAGLTQIPKELYEVAKLDGVGLIRQAFQITLPMMRRTMVLIGLLGVVNSIQLFDPVYLLTQGGPINSTNVLSFEIQRDAFEYGLAGQASAMAVSLVILVAVIAGVFMGAGKLAPLSRRLVRSGAR